MGGLDGQEKMLLLSWDVIHDHGRHSRQAGGAVRRDTPTHNFTAGATTDKGSL